MALYTSSSALLLRHAGNLSVYKLNEQFSIRGLNRSALDDRAFRLRQYPRDHVAELLPISVFHGARIRTGPWEFPQISWEESVNDISSQLRELSEPWEMGDKIKAAIGRSAKRSGLSYWRAFDLWYGKARRIEQSEINAVAAALAEKKRLETRNEVHDLRRRIEILESRLAQVDEDFHREEIGALRQQVRGLG